MKFSKLTVAIATVMTAGASTGAMAMDLYVDTKTKQLYAEPGPGRVLMGAFERVEDKPVAAPAEMETVQKDLELKTNEIKALQEHMEEVEKVKVTLDKKGATFETADKNFKFNLGGRIQTDANFTVNGNYVAEGTGRAANPPKPPIHEEANDGTEVRRARIDFTGTFYKDWNFKTQVDFADNAVAVKDLFIQYNGLDFMNFTGGQQKQNFSQELLESSNDLMFTERSLMNVLNAPVVDRAIGLDLQSSAKKGYTAALGFFGDTIAANKNNGKADEGWSIGGRGTYAPIEEKTKVMHLGLAGNYRQPNAADQIMDKALVYEYETDHMSNLFLIDAPINHINNISMLGAELKGLFGPFSGGGEYTHTWLSREKGNNNLSFDGWYVDAAWSITGESRVYKQGKFYKLSPDKKFSFKNRTWGAFELATRYSGVDLNNNGFKGGSMQNITVAVNWYFNDNIRLMTDWTRAFDVHYPAVTTVGGGAPNDNNTFTIRAQLAY